MTKKCIICHQPAKLRIKDGSEFYCEECAELQFGDISLLVKMDDQAKKLKKYIDDRADDDFKLNLEED